MKLIIINGPNLNLIGKREPAVYGNQTFENYFSELQLQFKTVQLAYFQSNIEGEIIDKLHETGFSYDGIILMQGLHTYFYWHWRCCKSDSYTCSGSAYFQYFFQGTFRHKSYIAPYAKGVVLGFGLQSYELAVKSYL